MRHNGVAAELVPGRSGEFTVVIDGREIWDKYTTGRFPAHDEILRELE